MINVAILGYGVIGSGTYTVITQNQDIVKKNAGDGVQVKAVLDLRDFPGSPVEDILTHDFNDILNDDEIDIVVEVMGGTGAAYTFVKASLEAGKSVVTSNKALVAAYGPELIRIAREKNINFMFEASVGGGIPIIRPLISCITADEILEITGILNGTTNFILTDMYEEGSEFEPVLKQAQANGFAEADPTADIEGHDACRKIAILTALAEGQFVDFGDIPCRGISGISAEDIAYAKALGKKIKLLASTRYSDGKVYSEVSPCMIDSTNPLYAVDGVMNAILVKGNMLGDVMFYGAGAGSLPTASAVVSDIVACCRHMHENIPVRMDPEKITVHDPAELKDRYFIRVSMDCDIASIVPCECEITIPDAEGEKAVITKDVAGSELTAVDGIISCIKVR